MSNVKINDMSILLNREEVQIKTELIEENIEGKVILVTGAGGSIGSEICRQLSNFRPKEIILLGRGEMSIYEISKEMNRSNKVNTTSVIADIQNKKRLDKIFKKYSPDIVYHAAASKHVPLMEDHPEEAVLNNIIGTKNLADLSDKYNVETFIMVSTDKAVKPTSVMGSSKRLSELLIQAMNKRSKTKFSIVRFGNVLGSSGSVVPLFMDQIERGEDITITHRDMTRYFMTIPEASKLVIQSSSFCSGGEIFILDMGKPVKIIDLAKNLIKIMGKTLDEVNIVEVGVRPGEKIHEELMSQYEILEEEVLPKTFVSSSEPVELEVILSYIVSLFGLDDDNLKKSIVYEANQY